MTFPWQCPLPEHGGVAHVVPLSALFTLNVDKGL